MTSPAVMELDEKMSAEAQLQYEARQRRRAFGRDRAIVRLEEAEASIGAVIALAKDGQIEDPRDAEHRSATGFDPNEVAAYIWYCWVFEKHMDEEAARFACELLDYRVDISVSRYPVAVAGVDMPAEIIAGGTRVSVRVYREQRL